MKTKITSVAKNHVMIEYDDPFMGERLTREFYAPIEGGYIRDGNTLNQICDALSSRGATLRWSGDYPMIEMIRREYRKYRRENAKYF